MKKIEENKNLLIVEFTSLAIQEGEKKMADIAELRSLIGRLSQQLTLASTEFSNLKQEVETLKQTKVEPTVKEYQDIETVFENGDQIQLEPLKVIPEFSGNQNQYRSWRIQVSQQMLKIKNFTQHPKYAAALGIVRAKVTKSASDILINNNTAYDFDAIIDRLDLSFADQRPLYVIEAEMTPKTGKPYTPRIL